MDPDREMRVKSVFGKREKTESSFEIGLVSGFGIELWLRNGGSSRHSHTNRDGSNGWFWPVHWDLSRNTDSISARENAWVKRITIRFRSIPKVMPKSLSEACHYISPLPMLEVSALPFCWGTTKRENQKMRWQVYAGLSFFPPGCFGGGPQRVCLMEGVVGVEHCPI